MQLKLSIGAILLLKHVLAYTGEKELNIENKEVQSPRKLNGEESSQRRHFYNATDIASKSYDDLVDAKRKEIKDKQDELVAKMKTENKQNDSETDANYLNRINSLVFATPEFSDVMKNAQKELEDAKKNQFDIELTDKTVAVVKKYFVEFGDKEGFSPADDEVADEIVQVLEIKD